MRILGGSLWGLTRKPLECATATGTCVTRLRRSLVPLLLVFCPNRLFQLLPRVSLQNGAEELNFQEQMLERGISQYDLESTNGVGTLFVGKLGGLRDGLTLPIL
eukprot:Lithocolla_globosa_v1_NODE_67_length_7144_cov_10.886601.p7 type:complete len:104 gc:universal NODE_67_length_7144_cov_10.886601:2656-2967(+)